MGKLSNTPKLQRGAIIGLDPENPLASIIVFQYNPSTMTRSLSPREQSNGASIRSKPQLLSGPPVETITLEVEIDATDQLEMKDSVAEISGIYPQLSALEMLLYPKSTEVIFNTALALAGTLEIVPKPAPLTLFIWGVKRVLPVKIDSFSITEQAYDSNLNPILANVNLTLRALSYNDFPVDHPGYYTFLAHQVVKETMATISSINDLSRFSI